MGFHVPENQTVSWTIYWNTVCDQCRFPTAFLEQRKSRIMQAFDMGEPIWMIVEEMNMIYRTRPARLDVERSPLELAKFICRQ